LVLPDEPELLVRQIGESGEPAAIPDLLPIIVTGNKNLISACAKAVHQLLQHLQPSDFARFDEYVRQGCPDWRVRREPWYMLKPKDVGHLASMGESSVSLLGIASSHTSGYVREEALRELGKIRNGAELPYLLIRANDWVEVIRSSAQLLILDRIGPDYLPHLLKWLPLVLRLGEASRNNHTKIVESVRKLFDSPEAQQTVYAGFDSHDRFVRRFCYEIALNANYATALTVFQRAFLERDPPIRLLAVRKLRAAMPNEAFNEILHRARKDTYMSVRREALRIFAEKYPGQAEQEFQTALLDSNIAIREEAQYFFRKKGILDVRAFYARHLETSSGGLLCAAIGGLGETGLPQDAVLFTRFIPVPNGRVRALALHALARLKPAEYFNQFLLSLSDPSARATTEALRALIKRASSLDGRRLWDIYTQCPYLHGKRAALFLLARINKWDSITFLIQSLAEEDAAFVALSQGYIARWLAQYNQTFPTPSKEQLARLKTISEKYKLLMNPGTQHQLDLLTKSFLS
jgi:HEAT repeat protein